MYRSRFPYFTHHPEVTYLDSAATTHKPDVVIEAVRASYEEYAPIHRGLYPSSVELTDRYEQVRTSVASFIGATNPHEVIFTKNATEASNLLALGLAQGWQAGDEVILSAAEHHSVLLPWQVAAQRHGLTLRFLELDARGVVDVENLPHLLSAHTRAIVLTHASNVLGSFTPIARVREILSEQGSAAVLIADVCQSIPHIPISVGELGVDFLFFSGHKLYAPTGVGVLWGRATLLQNLPPLLTGGNMVALATRTESTYQPAPLRFEAGTASGEAVIGLGAALEFLEEIDMSQVAAHTRQVGKLLREHLEAVPSLRILGDPDPESGIVSFSLERIHPHDVAQFLGERNICLRAGHMCAAPIHESLGIVASVRASTALYTTEDDIRALVEGLSDLYHTFNV